MTALHNDSSSENIGVYGSDPGGRHKRLVYPIVDSGHLMRSIGVLLETARMSPGTIVEVSVLQIRNAEEFRNQLLVYSSRHPQDPDGLLAHAMRAAANEFHPCAEVRHGYVSFVDGDLRVRLSSGQYVDVNVPGSPYGPFSDGEFLWCADDTPSNEERPEWFLRPNPDVHFVEGPSLTGMWYLHTVDIRGEDKTPHFFYAPVPPKMSFGGPESIFYIGPHPEGEKPFVLNARQAELVESGRASNRLMATVRKEAHRYNLQLSLQESGEEKALSYAKAYGVWHPQTLKVSDYVMGGTYCVEFGESILVSSDSATSAPTEADDRVASA